MTKNGTTHQMEAIWDEHARQLKAFLLSRVGADQADDVLQDVFVRIQEKLPSRRHEERLQSWIYQIARRAIVDVYRKRTVDHEDVTRELYSEDENEVRDDLVSCIEPFVNQLPDTCRDAVRMSELEGRKQAEVAGELGLSLSGAKSRIQRGRAAMASMLADCCTFHRDARGAVSDYEQKECRDCGC
jgi:RNA polymerase sigma-70 factor, ECF subfamily